MDILGAFGLTPQAGLCQTRTRAYLQSLLPAAPGAGHCFTPLCGPETWAWRGQKCAPSWAHSQASSYPSELLRTPQPGFFISTRLVPRTRRFHCKMGWKPSPSTP